MLRPLTVVQRDNCLFLPPSQSSLLPRRQPPASARCATSPLCTPCVLHVKFRASLHSQEQPTCSRGAHRGSLWAPERRRPQL